MSFRFSRWWVIVLGCAAALACSAGSSINPFRQPVTPAYSLGNMQALIQKSGGSPCHDNPDLTCITLTAPLDHFTPGNTKTLKVTFGIHPATGARKGMYVQAFPGGPGG